MNNLLSYCGLVDAKIRASDKDLPVIMKQQQTSAKQTRMSGEQNTSGLFDDLDELFGTLTAEEVAELSIVDPDVRLFIIIEYKCIFFRKTTLCYISPKGIFRCHWLSMFTLCVLGKCCKI